VIDGTLPETSGGLLITVVRCSIWLLLRSIVAPCVFPAAPPADGGAKEDTVAMEDVEFERVGEDGRCEVKELKAAETEGGEGATIGFEGVR
jgi:hypothetical protein